MKYCTHCGKELFDEAVICPACGAPCAVENTAANTVVNTAVNPAANTAVNTAANTVVNTAVNPAANTAVNTTANTVTADNGYNVNGADTVLRKKKKIKPLLVILCSVVLVLAILAAVLFVPRNLKMDDFKKTNMVSAILKYGCPDDISYNYFYEEYYLDYDNNVEFYGIIPDLFQVYPEGNEMTFFFDTGDYFVTSVIGQLDRHCNIEYISDFDYYYRRYSYEDLEITVSLDESYLSVDIDIN